MIITTTIIYCTYCSWRLESFLECVRIFVKEVRLNYHAGVVNVAAIFPFSVSLFTILPDGPCLVQHPGQAKKVFEHVRNNVYPFVLLVQRNGAIF